MMYTYPEAPERGVYELPFDTEGFIAWLRTKYLSDETIQRYVRALNVMIDENIMTRSYGEQICDYFKSEDDSSSLVEIIAFFDTQLKHQLYDSKLDDDIRFNRLTKYEVKKHEGYISAWHHYRDFLLTRNKHQISDYGWQVLETILTNHGIVDINIADIDDFTNDLHELYHYSFEGSLNNVNSLISLIKDKLSLKSSSSRVLLCIMADKPNIKVVQEVVDAVIAKTHGTMMWVVIQTAIYHDMYSSLTLRVESL